MKRKDIKRDIKSIKIAFESILHFQKCVQNICVIQYADYENDSKN